LGNQTWQTGKSPISRYLSGKFINKWGFQLPSLITGGPDGNKQKMRWIQTAEETMATFFGLDE